MPTLHDSGISTACMEHQVFEHIKQALLVTLNWQAPAVSMPRKLSSLQFTMKSLQRHFDRVVTIEEEGGYMAEVMDTKPYFQDRVEQLAQDHVRFRERLQKLDADLNDTKEWDEPRFERNCKDLRELIADLDRHNELENELLQESMLMDEGGEG
jgi:hemerythrin-like domain-containing protein